MVKTGLVMEGGAMRGIFTAGVNDVLMENGIEFDGAIGVSAGAAFGCNYKSRQIGRVMNYVPKYCNDWRFCSWRSWWETGDLYGADYSYDKIPNELCVFDRKTFAKNPMEFIVVATDVNTGKPVYQRLETASDKDIHWILASASMPLVSNIQKIDGYELLDGGIADSIPIKYFESLGYDRNVVILTQPLSFVKKKNPLLWLMKLVLRKYPHLLEAVAKRHHVYNETTAYIRQQEQAGKMLVLRPPQPLKIKAIEHNPEEIWRVYKIGRDVAEARLSEIQEFLAGKGN